MDENLNFNELFKIAIFLTEKLIFERPNFYPYQAAKYKLLDMNMRIQDSKKFYEEYVDKYNIGIMAAKLFDDLDFSYGLVLHDLSLCFFTQLAGAAGTKFLYNPNDPEQVKVYKFYIRQGYRHSRIIDHLRGIDFTKKIYDKHLISKDTNLQQWRLFCHARGDYYSDPLVIPEKVGINPRGMCFHGKVFNKTAFQHVTNASIEVLKTTAKAIKDDWSIKNIPFQANGGAFQYMNHKDAHNIN